MTVSVFTYSRRGMETAQRIAQSVDAELFTTARLVQDGFLPIPKPSEEFFGDRFESSDALIFVCSCGIAVRSIAPHLRSKTSDPAVIVVDDTGSYAIPILSGHIGGANALARRIANLLSATAVITTATDAGGRFSVDTWATEHGMQICGMKEAKQVSAAILERDVPMLCDLPVCGNLPSGIYEGAEGELGIYVTWRTGEPFGTTLRLIPKCLHVGVGCRRGTSKEAIASAVDEAFLQHDLDPHAIACVSSIDLKASEQGLLDFCRERGLPVAFHTAVELNAVPGEFTGSCFVRSVTGVDNVCERAAMLGADEIIVKKTAAKGVTVSVALEKTEVSFE